MEKKRSWWKRRRDEYNLQHVRKPGTQVETRPVQGLGVDGEGNLVAKKLTSDGTPSQVYKFIPTDKDVYFTEAIVVNAKEDENIDLVTTLGFKTNKMLIVAVAIQSIENLDFDLFISTEDTFDDVDIDEDTYIEWIDLNIPADGVRIGAANQYYLTTRLDPPLYYEDEDATLTTVPKVIELHASLVCRTAAGKSATPAGDVKLIFTVIPL